MDNIQLMKLQETTLIQCDFTSVDSIAASPFLHLSFCLCYQDFSELLCRVKDWERVGVQQAEECARRGLDKFANSKAPGLLRLYSPPEICGLSETLIA